MRGAARAVVCEKCRLGQQNGRIGTPCCSKICPQDVKNMLQEQARKVFWWKWAAKHECEELEEGKANEERTDKHRTVTKKLAVKRGWVQKGLHDIGWSDEKK